MKKGIKKTNKKFLTEAKFDKTMLSVAKSFERVDQALDRINRTLEVITKELQAIHEDHKHFRQSISSLNSDGISYDRKIENLTIRVEKLEAKV